MANLNEFSRRMNLRADRLGTNADKLVRKVALVADQAIVTSTPVDTGRARSNWIVQLDSAADQIISAYSEGRSGSTESENTQAAIDQGSRVISNYQTGRVIHISNNLDYIQDLNDGTSAQAPPNFVEIAVMEAVEAIRGSRLVE